MGAVQYTKLRLVSRQIKGMSGFSGQMLIRASDGWCHDRSVSDQPPAPVRSFRIPDDVYLPAQAKAKARGDALSEIVRSALIEYVRDYE